MQNFNLPHQQFLKFLRVQIQRSRLSPDTERSGLSKHAELTKFFFNASRIIFIDFTFARSREDFCSDNRSLFLIACTRSKLNRFFSIFLCVSMSL